MVAIILPAVFTALVFAATPAAKAAAKPSLQDALAAKVDFAVDSSSFEQGLLALAAKLKVDYPDFQIKIIGNNLKFEGITKNQTIRGLKIEKGTVAEVLTAMVLKADPNSRGKGPSDPSLKLVWLVGADPENAERQVILITTRAGANKRGDKLPEIFLEQKDSQRP